MIERAHDLRRALLRLPRRLKRAMAIGTDAALCGLTVWLAYYLRLGEWVPLRGAAQGAAVASVVLAIPIFILSGLYRTIFRFAEASFVRIATAIAMYGLVYAAIFTVIQFDNVPRTVGLIQPLLLFIAVAGSRFAAAWALIGAHGTARNGGPRHQALIYGAGSAGRQLFRALIDSEIRVVGFLDDDEQLHGQLLFGRPVLPPRDLGTIIGRYKVGDVLLAIPSASRQRRQQIIETIRPFTVAVRTLPGVDDLAQGRVKASELRELSIEDLLGREAVSPDVRLLKLKVSGRTVLITGAGGSIGSELCRQVLAMEPSHLLLVESSEAVLYTIHQELEGLAAAASSSCEIVPLLASVCDGGRIGQIMTAWRPHTIYHAAAYKHVPLVEHNPAEGICNNVFGTLTVARAAIEAGVADFVLISTDKAVRPTNVMGASKRLAEEVLQALAATKPDTSLSMVRFGNVLGSSGSVVPLFRKQIAAGGPLTITDPEIVRYFMTIPEAAQLVLQAGAMARGGEVFVLDMGEPIKIVDLARAMVELSGLTVCDEDRPDGDIELSFVGLRPGEKLYEELLIGNNPEKTSHPRILRANEPFTPWPQFSKELERLRFAIEDGNIDRVIKILGELVPDYVPEYQVVDWVHLQHLAN